MSVWQVFAIPVPSAAPGEGEMAWVCWALPPALLPSLQTLPTQVWFSSEKKAQSLHGLKNERQ